MNKEMVYERILEIIFLSQNKINSANQSEFVTINRFSIHKDYEEEFNNLLMLEEVMFLKDEVQNGNLITTRQNSLIQECNNNLSSENGESYQRIIDILEYSNSMDSASIIEKDGYFIAKEYYNEFSDLCKKLKVGLYSPVKNMTKEELSSMGNEILQKQLWQRDRINDYESMMEEKILNLLNHYFNEGVSVDKLFNCINKVYDYHFATMIIKSALQNGFITPDEVSYQSYLTR